MAAQKQNSSQAKKKATSAKKKTNQSTTQSKVKQKPTAESKVKQQTAPQVGSIVLFCIGLLIFAIIVIPGTNVWLALHRFMRGTFGVMLFAVPILLIYLGVHTAKKPEAAKLRHKLWQLLFMLALLCALVQVLFVGEFIGGTLSNIIHNLYVDGLLLRNGGALSVVIGMPLLMACGRAGAAILMMLFSFAFWLLMTGATLADVFGAVKRPVQSIERHYERKREQREARFDIDVDLGPDTLPEHPVSSSRNTFETSSNPAMKRRFREMIKQTTELVPPEVADPQLLLDDDLPNQASVATPPSVQNDPICDDNQQPLDTLVQKAAENEKKPSKQKEPTPPPPRISIAGESHPQYQYPPVTLLKAVQNKRNKDLSEELRANAELLVDTLKSFGVQTRVVDISRGPTVTRYELQPSAGVKISRITGLADDIALNLASAGVRIEAPIPNKAAVGIEVPNRETDIVTIREIIDSEAFHGAASRLAVALGRDISGKEVVFDIAKMPHMLIAGATGSGKSVCINTLIMSILYKSSPEEVRLLMIDPKVVELGVYNGIPHLLVPVVTDPRKAAGALGWAVTEMLNRYKLFADNQVRDLFGYNQLAKTNEELDPLPQIVLIIDELADLMMAAPNEVEDAICRLAQMARAAGMHLVIATQRPSVDVITGVIKANVPSRIAFSVSSQVDSRTIIDSAGAEKLLGRGDMLFYPVGSSKPTRLQCCYVSDTEVEAVVQFIKSDMSSEYDNKIMDEIEKQAVKEKGKGKQMSDGGGFEDDDELLPQAVECVLEAKQASTSYLQRRLKVGYARAARLMDDMESKGIIGPSEGSKPRQLLITREMWLERQTTKPSIGG